MRKSKNIQTGGRIREATWIFADGRLEDRELIEWALALGENQTTERDTLQELFEVRGPKVKEPYGLAWRCIFESWDRPATDDHAERYHLRREMQAGATQRETVRLIVDAVAPVMKVEAVRHYNALSGEAPSKRPTKLRHLLWARISSGERLKPEDIGLAQEIRRDFLVELGAALGTAVLSGLNMARDIGAIDDDMDISNWQVHRVYFVSPDQFVQGGGEPDRHSDGFAPSTKLLSSVVDRLAALDVVAAKRIVQSWDIERWPLFRRLWAAAARDGSLVDGAALGSFLAGLRDEEFWWFSSYPEIAEVRAVRWNDLSVDSRTAIEKRLLKGEPKKLFPRGLTAEEKVEYGNGRIKTELGRIRHAGGVISPRATRNLNSGGQDGDGGPPIAITHGFNPGVRMLSGRQTPGRDYSNSSRAELLAELATALASDGWDNESQNASEYIAQNASIILDGLEQRPTPAVARKVWQAFGYALRPKSRLGGNDTADDADTVALPVMRRACALIVAERDEVLAGAVRGLSSFMSSWDRLLADDPNFLVAWMRLWGHAVADTIAGEPFESPLADKVYNSAVGQLADALTGPFPPVSDQGDLERNPPWSFIMDAIASAPGNAAIAARYVLLGNLAYLSAAAPDWTARNLIAPLHGLDYASVEAELWESFANRWQPIPQITAPLVDDIVAAAIAADLPVTIRKDLAQVAVFAVLFDRAENRDPVFPVNLVAQILRMGGDAVRRSAVDAFEMFLRQDDTMPVAERFDVASAVFDGVWPKEVTLNSASVSEELVQFAAAAGSRYADAVELVSPYLTPFKCWSILDFRVYDPTQRDNEFMLINDTSSAAAFLEILDKSVGDEDGAVIPHDLEDGLTHIAGIAPKLERDTRFQRLRTLARR